MRSLPALGLMEGRASHRFSGSFAHSTYECHNIHTVRDETPAILGGLSGPLTRQAGAIGAAAKASKGFERGAATKNALSGTASRSTNQLGGLLAEASVLRW